MNPKDHTGQISEKVTFNWQDPFLLDELLSDEERMIQQTARDFAQDRLLPGITEANRHEAFDPSLMREMGSLGLLGPMIEGYGCAGGLVCSHGAYRPGNGTCR